MSRSGLLGLALFSGLSSGLFSQGVWAKPSFEQYVLDLKAQAVEKGYEPAFLDRVFTDVQFYQRSVKADKNQPEFKVTLDTYLPKRLPKWKRDKAAKLYSENRDLLRQIENTYQVQGRYIIALWGVESNFGKFQGKFPVISALTTMAYEGLREKLFKRQLFAALAILRQGHISQDKFLGSWAGAMGQSQFMPTSFLAYAQDFDGDGKKDIWGSKADVFASIAYYLKAEGWDDSATWGRQVQVPSGLDLSMTGLAKKKMQTLAQWQALGVRRMDGRDLPQRQLKASLILPDDKGGRAYLVYSNFHTLMHWNRSTYFGVSVGHLSDFIWRGEF